MRFEFGEHVVDSATLELRRDGEVVPMEAGAFSVLQYLLEHRDRVVPKTELLDEIWGDRFVSESALTTRIRQIRQAVLDSGRDQRVIRTSFGAGYQFVAAVEVHDHPGPGAVGRAAATTARVGTAPLDGSVVGRADDRARIDSQLDRARLVTLVGAAGIGKTCLLDAAARDRSAHFADGAVVVELAPLRSSDAVAPTVLDAIGGAVGGGDPVAQIVAELRPRNVLLVVDNAEHVLGAVADLCATVLGDCPNVSVLVSSRQRLGIGGESVVEIGPLTPEASAELFLERAAAVGVEVEGDDPDVVRLCERSDGIPLAIELLAARARLLSLHDLASDASRHFARVTPAPGDDRHQSVEHALRWSLEQLAPDDRRLLAELSVFAGSFDLPAVDRVAERADSTDALLRLCEASLVVPRPGDGSSRFVMLEPVRFVAADDGHDLAVVRRRHSGHYLAVAQDTARLLETSAVDDAFDRYAAEWSNISAAATSLLQERDVEPLGALIDAVADVADGRLLVEVHEWAVRHRELCVETGHDQPATSIANLVRFLAHRGEIAEMRELMTTVDPELALGSTHVAMGFVTTWWYSGQVDDAHELLDHSLERIAGSGGYTELVFGLLRVASSVGRERPVAVLDRLGAMGHLDGRFAAIAGAAAAAVERQWAGDPTAVEAYEQAMDAADAVHGSGIKLLLSTMRSTALWRLESSDESADDVASGVAESLERGMAASAWSVVSGDLFVAGSVLRRLGRGDVAARLAGALDAAGYGSSTMPRDDDASVAAYRQGRLLTLEQAARVAVNALREH